MKRENIKTDRGTTAERHAPPDIVANATTDRSNVETCLQVIRLPLEFPLPSIHLLFTIAIFPPHSSPPSQHKPLPRQWQLPLTENYERTSNGVYNFKALQEEEGS